MSTAALDHVQAIYRAAREVSWETRGELASSLAGLNLIDPAERWEDIIRRRTEGRLTQGVRAAGGKVVNLAGAGELGRAVRRAVRNLVEAVGELAGYRPGFETVEIELRDLPPEWGIGPGASVTEYRPTPASVARLDELRQAVFVRLVELDELLRDHPDPIARVLAVLRRIAVRLVPTAEGARVARWCERMEADPG